MLLKTRAETLYRELCPEIGRFAPGGRFYSIRQLMTRFRVSRRVVDAALNQMAAQGTLEIRPNSGVFVRRNRVCRSVAFFHLDWPGEVNKALSEHLANGFSGEDEVEFYAFHYSYEADIVKMLEQCNAEAVIIGYPAREPAAHELAFFLASERPIITLERDLRDIGLHSTSGNPTTGAFLAVRHFVRNGHRRLAVLPAEPLKGEVVRRMEAFYDYARLFQCEVREIPCMVRDGDYSATVAREALAKDLEVNGCDYTGLFIPGDSPCKGALLAFREAGIRVPEDVSLIGYGFSPEPRYYHPPVTTIACRPADCARSLVLALKKYFAGDHSLIAIRDTPVILERESVRNLATNGK